MYKSYVILVLFIFVKVTSLVAQNKNISTIKDTTLREVYKGYFPIGTAVPSYFYRSATKRKFIGTQYSSLTPEDQMKPRTIHPKENKFNWSETDSLVAFAKTNNMKVRGHCLIWYHRMPNWFYFDQNQLASKELLLSRMKKHITEIMLRYKGEIYCYDVINEAISSNYGEMYKSEDTLYRTIGEEYIEKAFQYAHEADPTAKLFYNDTNFNIPEKREKIYTLLKKLKQKGIPIDGVGIQCHLGIQGMQEKMFDSTIKMFSDLGLDVQVTELDISIYNKFYPEQLVGVSDAYTPEIIKKQYDLYEMIFRICRKNKDKITGITMWGSADGNNFLTQRLKKKNYPYLFDENFKPKKAFFGVTRFK